MRASTSAGQDTVRTPVPETVVPFEFEDTRLYVPVGIRDQLHWFILDTGAQPTVIDERVASALGIAGRDTTSTTGAGTGSTRRSTGGETKLRIGALTMTVAAPAIAPIDALLSRYTGRHAPGILGSQFFTGRAVTIDFDQRTVVARRTVDERELARAIVLPLMIEGGIPYLSATLRFAPGKVMTAKLLVDLGAKATLLLTEPFIERAGLGALQASGVPSSLGAGIGGETRYAFVRLPSLELEHSPATRLDSAVIGLSIGGTLRSRGYDGLLGAEYLQRFRVTFDYAHRRLILRPRVPAPANPDFDMSGMFLVAEGDDLRAHVVADVAPGSAAAAAGVRAGDRIVAVDGRDARGMTLSAVRSQLRGPAGRRVVMQTQRGGVRSTVTLELARRV